MTTFSIKLLAICTMLTDHIGAIFFPEYVIFRLIGRLSFPLFAWLIANGAKHTRDIRKYFVRLLIFAAVSQIPYQLAFDINTLNLNVFFTLSFGLGCIMFYSSQMSKSFKLIGITALCALGISLNVNYDIYGILSILLFYVYFNNLYMQIISQVFIYTSYTFLPILLSNPTQILSLSIFGLGQLFAPLSILFTSRYNGREGISAKQFFYLFYPVHLAVLYIFKVVF